MVSLAFKGGGPDRDTVLLGNALAAKGIRVTILVCVTKDRCGLWSIRPPRGRCSRTSDTLRNPGARVLLHLYWHADRIIAQTDEAADQRWIVNLHRAILDPTAFKLKSSSVK